MRTVASGIRRTFKVAESSITAADSFLLIASLCEGEKISHLPGSLMECYVTIITRFIVMTALGTRPFFYDPGSGYLIIRYY